MTKVSLLQRRAFLKSTAVAAGVGVFAPTVAFAAMASQQATAREAASRFVFIIQRGAADGLNIVVPYAEPAYSTLRGPLAIDPASLAKLDGTFGLHSSLSQTATLYHAGEALFVQAVASPYRDRSHFDGQNVLETGGLHPYQLKDGWLNRLAAMLSPPSAGNGVAIAFAPTVPLALRGPIDVMSYANASLPPVADDLLLRVSKLYERDAQLHALWSSAMTTTALAASIGGGHDAAATGKMAAGFLSRPDGPRIAMIETGGWDTHTAQNPRLATQLKSLDAMLYALREGMGDRWANTTVVVATEFGRTAASNGTGGTDHGTGTAAMLLGGAVRGGRVMADWPGLGAGALYEGRDLRATTGLDSLIATAAAETFGLDPARVARQLFPLSPSMAMPSALLRT